IRCWSATSFAAWQLRVRGAPSSRRQNGTRRSWHLCGGLLFVAWVWPGSLRFAGTQWCGGRRTKPGNKNRKPISTTRPLPRPAGKRPKSQICELEELVLMAQSVTEISKDPRRSERMDKSTVLSKHLAHALPILVLPPIPSVHWQQWPPPPVSSRPRTFTSARLPNRRIEHGVVQRKKDFAVADAMVLKYRSNCLRSFLPCKLFGLRGLPRCQRFWGRISERHKLEQRLRRDSRHAHARRYLLFRGREVRRLYVQPSGFRHNGNYVPKGPIVQLRPHFRWLLERHFGGLERFHNGRGPGDIHKHGESILCNG